MCRHGDVLVAMETGHTNGWTEACRLMSAEAAAEWAQCSGEKETGKIRETGNAP